MIWVTISSVANLYAFRSLQKKKKMLWSLSVTISVIQISRLDKSENSANSALSRREPGFTNKALWRLS